MTTFDQARLAVQAPGVVRKDANTDTLEPSVVVRIAFEELDRLRALQIVPDADLLLERLQNRIGDYRLIAGVSARFLCEVS